MISGFVARDGQRGTANLAAAGRHSLPQWAARAYNRSATLATTEYGPNVTAGYPLGRYVEDNDYLGDLGFTPGVDFDLNEFNARFCVTPEFPGGTWAYFVTINSNGTSSFPYNLGRSFFGTPSGGSVTGIPEPVQTNFIGGANAEIRFSKPTVESGTVTLSWSATEGGTYRIESTADFAGWTANASNLGTVLNRGFYSGPMAGSNAFHRAARTALAPYDAN
jgi:hypothetical protein